MHDQKGCEHRTIFILGVVFLTLLLVTHNDSNADMLFDGRVCEDLCHLCTIIFARLITN